MTSNQYLDEIFKLAFKMYKNKDGLTFDQFVDKGFLDQSFQNEFNELTERAKNAKSRNDCSQS
jgi:hypothetical protein